jgi:hypothetical protein
MFARPTRASGTVPMWAKSAVSAGAKRASNASSALVDA